jgi:glyoxylase-like metal-dependent hydrolase (beta-lactamase superfamily II)
MQMSTVVINPPDGDMRAYIESLRSLLELELDWLAPGHGFLMPEPRKAMEKVIAHRLGREAKVLEALHALAPASSAALLARVYADVPPKMHPIALRSLTAHLLKLRDDGIAAEADGVWALR